MFRRMFCLDMRLGTTGVAAPLIGVALCSFSILIDRYALIARAELDVSLFTWGDNIALVFSGSLPHRYLPGVLFVPPLGWLLLLMFIFSATLSYPYRDLMGFGKQLLVRERSRRAWWASKCLWVLTVTLACVFVAVAASAIWTVMHGQTFGWTVRDADIMIESTMPEKLLPSPAPAAPLITSITAMACALSLLQLSASLVIRPTYAYCGTLAILIASAFAQHVLLPGNFLMLLRWGGLITDGVQSAQGLIYAVVIAAASVIAGGFYVSRMDIVDKEMAA